MQLSTNFNLNEFIKSAGLVITPTQQQIFCLSLLAQNVLQPIRNKFGNTVITSGLRNEKSHKSLISKGYPASTTSDHFAWSKENPIGTGAADIVCPNAEMFLVFEWIQSNIFNNIGQVIYYPDKGFIHVSNRFSNIFCMPDPRKEETRALIYRNGKFVPIKVK